MNTVKQDSSEWAEGLNLMAGLEANTGLPLLPFYP